MDQGRSLISQILRNSHFKNITPLKISIYSILNGKGRNKTPYSPPISISSEVMSFSTQINQEDDPNVV